jgi:hypothetical protein
MRAAHSPTYDEGWTYKLTPPAIAIWHLPCRSCSQASWIAVNDDEHIVSIGMLGPLRFST